MAAEGPGRQPDVDEEFARIIAGWGQVSSTSGSSSLPPPDAAASFPDPSGQLVDRREQAQSSSTEPPSAEPPSAEPLAVEPLAVEPPGADERPPAAGATGVERSGEPGDDPGPVSPGPPQEQPGPPWEPAWRGYLPEEPDEHFEPPEPQLPPAHDATYWLAVLGLVGGPLLVLWTVAFSANPDPGWWVLVGILLTVAGFGLLVLRGSGDRDPGDDGSRV